MASIITSKEELDFTISELPELPRPGKVLMVRPDHFDIEYVINPYMHDNLGSVDKQEALEQWKQIIRTYQSLGLEVDTLKGREGLPDMVFCANQSLPYRDPEGQQQVVMSIMYSDQRKNEVPYIEQWYRQQGYEIHYLDEEQINSFEGMGDALWHPGRRLLWGGYGYRTDQNVYPVISELYDVPVITLELISDYFYHLDTCLCLLDEKTAMIHPPAFTKQSLKLINHAFGTVIEADTTETRERMACNAVCPDGENVLIQEGCDKTSQKLVDAGYVVHQLNTDEFLKSGGSVFCMKMLLW